MPLIESPREHVLNRESKQAFECAIPAEWLCRWQPLDYGIDCTVEVANPEEGVTGETFAVQVKATDDEAPRSVRLETDHLRYYEMYPLPVLVVVYSSLGEEVYGRWVHEIIGSMSPDRRRQVYGQNTLTINYEHDHRLVRDEADDLRTDLQEELGRRRLRPSVSIIVRQAGDDETVDHVRARLSQELRSWADELAPGRVQVLEGMPENEGPLPIHVHLERDDGGVAISLSGRDVVQPVLDEFSVSRPLDEPFSWLPDPEPSLPAAHILVVAALELGASGDPDSASRLLIRAIPACASTLEQMPPLVGTIAMMFGAARRTSEALLLAEQLASEGFFEASASLAFSSPFSADRSIADPERYQNLLRRCVDGTDRSEALGPLCYNLANSLWRTRNLREAVSFYHHAAIHQPSYRDRAYWWQELGGCLFDTGHYSWSAEAYRRALEVSESNRRILRIRPKYGDALAFSGHYQDAVEAFDTYLDGADRPEPEWILKSLLLHGCIQQDGVEAQVRRTGRAADLCEEARQLRDAGDVAAAREGIAEGLETDLLCPRCWLELELLAVEEERFEEVHFAESMRAVFGRSLSACVAATVNGFSSQLSRNEVRMSATMYLMEFGHEAFGADYADALRERLERQSTSPEQVEVFQTVVRLVLDPDYSREDFEGDLPSLLWDLD